MGTESLSQFIEASARIMWADRPDLWSTVQDAVEDISTAFSDASGLDDDEECVIHFSGYTLTRSLSDDMVEYTLSKKLVGLGIYPADEESGVFDWTHKSEAFGDFYTGLPEYEEYLDLEPDLDDDLNYEEDD